MCTNLKPLLLPQLVEERRKRESILDSEMDLSSSSYSQASSASDAPSPVTPTFSGRGHVKYSSSTSSMDSTFHASGTDSPSSPTFAVSKGGKRSLPDVQEEPQERDDDLDMFDDDDASHDLYDCLCDNQPCLHRDPSVAQSSEQLSMQPPLDYDLADGFFSDGEYALSPRYKKRRANESALTGFADRIGNRFPSLSRKWRLRKGNARSANSIASDPNHDKTGSRTASSRSSSVSNPTRQALEKSFEGQMPPSPTASVVDARDDSPPATPIDIEKANHDSARREEPFATTPLLPPLMTEILAHIREVPTQSPLQSPSVAAVKDPWSGNVTPIDAIATPQLAGIPSPPLSTKPSISSFHRGTVNRPGHLIPSSEIPSIHIADANDEWANKLGHANFCIQPEPYLPDAFDVEACRQLRARWDEARCNYTKHLVRTGEHYGVTSKAYKLTEEKWLSIDAIWRKNNDRTIAQTVENGSDALATFAHATLGDDSSSNVMTRIPSLNDPRSEGKFPLMGDEDIVGPMVQVAAQLQRSPSKKAKLLKFFTEKFPVGLSRP
ncbi:hypothetical protein BJ875DRAFT_154510 [Amylocarpus encephaloides]|uniref:Only prolin and serin are matching in the corresponding protein n=1 Tax=Amylocarpus encephaloides TaxID=45428 RepID=A0A9P7YBX9_9HELO|nr:hypothetical protein BJ875DRAFT_154510 [Amylocarpus encephaloides]